VDNGYFLPLKRKSIRLSEVHLHPLVYIGLAGCLDLISEFRDWPKEIPNAWSNVSWDLLRKWMNNRCECFQALRRSAPFFWRMKVAFFPIANPEIELVQVGETVKSVSLW